MARIKTLQELFKRYRRPGDIVFAWAFLILAIALISQLGAQTEWSSTGKLFAQPRFWPAVSLTGMLVFASLHLFGSIVSDRIPGRLGEVKVWAASLEYAAWFMAYVYLAPKLGYLPATILFMAILTFRAGYRSRTAFLAAIGSAIVIVVVFRTFLHVKLPAGDLYELLPDGIRQIMLTYF
ncbi:MAG TPA: tripartite tricarboxylate transporter TctB family protein [Paracoccaceae bacterium]|nr:tripartite tricarboxylate transporter TctB family protein [Paracoccaceae bacterium]